MACDITKGMKLPCLDQRGGIKFIDFAPYNSTLAYTIVNGEIATLPVGLTEVFRYELKGTGNTLVETATTSVDTGTTEIAQVITAVAPKLGKEKQVELQAMLYGASTAFVHDYNGNVMVVGIDSGLRSTGGVKQTGGAGTDLSGYNINLSAMDSKYSPFLSPSAITALNALVSDEVITP